MQTFLLVQKSCCILKQKFNFNWSLLATTTLLPVLFSSIHARWRGYWRYNTHLSKSLWNILPGFEKLYIVESRKSSCSEKLIVQKSYPHFGLHVNFFLNFTESKHFYRKWIVLTHFTVCESNMFCVRTIFVMQLPIPFTECFM